MYIKPKNLTSKTNLFGENLKGYSPNTGDIKSDGFVFNYSDSFSYFKFNRRAVIYEIKNFYVVVSLYFFPDISLNEFIFTVTKSLRADVKRFGRWDSSYSNYLLYGWRHKSDFIEF